MIKIADLVEQIINSDDDAKLAMQRGIINLSSYARQIRPTIEKQLFKDVDEKSVVVALSRLQLNRNDQEVAPIVKLSSISIHSDLADIGYEKTKVNIDRIQKIYTKHAQDAEKFVTMTQSVNEVTLIGNEELIDEAKAAVGSEPIFFQKSLTGITTKFGREYLPVPNIIYQITRALAVRQINIIEIVSTTTELTFIIDKQETSLALEQLQKFL